MGWCQIQESTAVYVCMCYCCWWCVCGAGMVCLCEWCGVYVYCVVSVYDVMVHVCGVICVHDVVCVLLFVCGVVACVYGVVYMCNVCVHMMWCVYVFCVYGVVGCV